MEAWLNYWLRVQWQRGEPILGSKSLEMHSAIMVRKAKLYLINRSLIYESLLATCSRNEFWAGVMASAVYLLRR